MILDLADVQQAALRLEPVVHRTPVFRSRQLDARAGSELYRGLASVILGGMFISTIGTLVLVPAVLSWVIETREWVFGEADSGGVAAPAGATRDH